MSERETAVLVSFDVWRVPYLTQVEFDATVVGVALLKAKWRQRFAIDQCRDCSLYNTSWYFLSTRRDDGMKTSAASDC